MKAYQRIIVSIMILLILLLSVSCSRSDVPEETEVMNIPEPGIIWDEITENGVDEELLIRNIDEETLKTIAEKLQIVAQTITAKGDADRSYWLTAQWFTDVQDSEEFKEVTSMGISAAKPLYLIVYKSENQGLYEYICAMALDEVFGQEYGKADDDTDWATSKELLGLINERIIENRKQQ